MNKTGRFGNTEHSNNFFIAERYTEDALGVIECARHEAFARNSPMVTVADLLAGMGMEESSRAARVGLLKQNAFYLRWLTGMPPLPAIDAPLLESPLESLPLDQEAKRAMACAVSEADRDREYWIDSDHLLRGLLCFPNRADFALLKTELSLSTARSRSRLDREEFLPVDNPSLKVVEYLVRKHLALWVPPIVSAACYLYILMQTIGIGLPPLTH